MIGELALVFFKPTSKMAANDIVLKDGWAVKESGQAMLGQTNWRRRWFRLTRNAEGQVTWAYYRNKEDISSNQCAGHVELDSTYIARNLEVGEKKKKPHCFALGPLFDNLMAKRTYYISCESEADKLSWMEVIGAAIESDFGSSTDTFNANRSIKSRIDRQTKKQMSRNRPVVCPSSAVYATDYLDSDWRFKQWDTLCSVIRDAKWKKTDVKNGVTVARLSFKHEPYAVIKVEGSILVPPEIVFDYLLTALRPGGRLDHPFRHEKVLQILEDVPRSSVVYNSYNIPLPSMSNRDCCLIRTWMPSYITQNSTSGLVLTSINHPLEESPKRTVHYTHAHAYWLRSIYRTPYRQCWREPLNQLSSRLVYEQHFSTSKYKSKSTTQLFKANDVMPQAQGRKEEGGGG
ncbi:uncharacterized protein LOC5502147 isoform X2 [Nematostella vectensis]|uniref:uncharacterized protein LOC5502147 isoform X2 n=1 Tax=Nematostella vectensis TaxID=45351 RepID=UPI0020777DF3|nr:uncharacterized protein LOC5502147 isoform X2 [Nematostella vectensis]